MKKLIAAVSVAVCVAFAGSAIGQTYNPANWVNDPFSANANFILTGGNTSSPLYSNNGVGLGSLFGNSPIGATLTLVNPGDTVTFSGQVAVAGNVNTAGNVQFRLGLFYQGASVNDVGWLGYMFSNPTGAGGGGIYLRNIPNAGIYGSGTGTTQPTAGSFLFAPGWNADTYNFSLSISMLDSTTDVMTWNLSGLTDGYAYSGNYTNAFVATRGGRSFDQVGFLGGGSMFNAPSAADSIGFLNATVLFTSVPEPATISLLGLGILGLILRRRA